MKKNRKIITLLLCLVLGLLVFAGCSTDAVNYMKISKEVASLPYYEFDGTIDMSIDYQPEAATAEELEAMGMLKDIKVKYSGEADTENFRYHMLMDMTFGGKTYPLEIYMSAEEFLMSAEDFVNMTNSFLDAETAAANVEAIGDVEWLDLYDMPVSMSGVLGLGDIDLAQFTDLTYDFMDYLAENSFKNYAPDIFGASGNGYTLTIKADKAKVIAEEFVEYLFDNYDAIMTDLANFSKNIPDSLLASLNTTRAELEEGIASLAAMTATPEEKAEFITAVNGICEYLDGSEYESYYAKTGTNKYVNTEKLKMDLTVLVGEPFSINLDASMNIDASKKGTVDMPATGVSSLQQIAEGQKSTSVSGTFYMEDNYIVWSKYYEAPILNYGGVTDVEPKLVNNLNYFPLRQIGELFDETVVWDQKTGEIYVLQGDNKILMTGLIQNNRTYIKLRDFEKLGYTINYTKDETMGGIATFDR